MPSQHIALFDPGLFIEYFSTNGKAQPLLSLLHKSLQTREDIQGLFTREDWDSLKAFFQTREKGEYIVEQLERIIDVHLSDSETGLHWIVTDHPERFAQKFQNTPDCSVRHFLTLVLPDSYFLTVAVHEKATLAVQELLTMPSNTLLALEAATTEEFATVVRKLRHMENRLQSGASQTSEDEFVVILAAEFPFLRNSLRGIQGTYRITGSDITMVRTELRGYDAVGKEVWVVGMGFNQSWVQV